MSDKLKEAIEKLKWLSENLEGSPMKEVIDMVVNEVEKECDHPYAFVHGGCEKAERCLKCGKILSD